MYRKNTAGQFVAFQGVDATTGGIKSGVTWTMRRCIDGTFAAGGGTVTEDSTNGWYKCALTQADTNGNNIAYNFTGTGAVPQTVNIITDGSPPDVNLKNAAGTAVTLDANNVLNVSTKYVGGTLQTARDIGASVLVGDKTGFSLSAAGVSAIWQDTTAGDFTAANSIGKSIMNGVSLGTGLTIAAVSGAVGSVTGAVGSVTGNVGGNVVGSVGSVTGAVGSVTGAVGSVTGLTASNLDATISSRATPAQILTTALTESYANKGSAPTLTQAIIELLQMLNEKSVAGTTLTVNKLDGATPAMTFTLNDSVNPTALTRAT